MKNLQEIKNQWYLEKIRKRGVRLGDELTLIPFNEKKQKIKLQRMSYGFSSQIGPKRPWIIQLAQAMEKEFRLELQLIADGRDQEGRYLLSSLCTTPFKINGSFCYQSFVERGDEVEFGLHQMTVKDEVKVSNSTSIASKVLEGQIPILIEGETGTGKTHLARQIYEQSRPWGRFVHLNLSSFSSQLFESELFGHVKGSFTGALRDKEGAFSLAHGGILFIDEIDSLPCELQAKLLLLLDDGNVRPVGAERSKKVRARLIVASGRNLQDLVEAGHMRKDFFFRIQSGHRITLRPLRENVDQIRAICQDFAAHENIDLSQQLLEFYQRCSWPGNIRQLKGHLQAKKIVSPSRKWELDDFDHSIYGLSRFHLEGKRHGHFYNLQEVKKKYIRYIFESCQRDFFLGAKILKIGTSTMRKYIGEEFTA